ncbi:MAG: ATP phosphoribosyltransferase regulatory subunit [Oscillospiraceae bacterium]|nr:ATP phosphoribosyltransferase regulatory subunit [Oscillospiraceae bacterium]
MAQLLPPQGFRDSLPSETSQRIELLYKLYQLYDEHGFNTVETPMLEPYGLLQVQEGSFDSRVAMKLVSQDGSVLVVRPDSTLPVLRLASLYYADSPLPIRLSYQQKILRTASVGSYSRAEQTQAGVELIGGSSREEDAEVLLLAITSLEALNINDPQIDIGHVGFFNGLMEEAGLTEAQTEKLRQMVEKKDALAIELALSEYKRESLRETITRLPMLFGGKEVIDEAYEMSAYPPCRAALDHLKDLIGILGKHGKGGNVTFDLGMVQSIDYYTGIVFNGITANCAHPLLSGGRYDTLPKAFCMNRGAVGFAIYMDNVQEALRKGGSCV